MKLPYERRHVNVHNAWAAAVAHFHTWDDGHYRSRGAVAEACTLAGNALLQSFLVRRGNSRWYGDVWYVFFDSASCFAGGNVPASVSSFERHQRIGAGRDHGHSYE